MIRELHLENYRSFENYALKDLARVNLLVGGNDCGKTSILEAVRLHASVTLQEDVEEIARRRGEFQRINVDSNEGNATRLVPTVSHFFRGHRWAGAPARIASEEYALHIRPGGETNSYCHLSRHDLEGAPLPGKDRFETIIETEPDGSILHPTRKRFSNGLDLLERKQGSIMILPDGLDVIEMIEPWNSVQMMGREADVTAILQTLDPKVAGQFFVVNPEEWARFYGVFLRETNGNGSGVLPSPLGSHGDGIRHLLSIAVCIVSARRPYLLIDEIDTGIHYSLMAKLWRMVIEAALREDLQVFATTHSRDCLGALAGLCGDYPNLAEDVRIHSIVRGRSRVQAVSVGGERLEFLLESGIDVR